MKSSFAAAAFLWAAMVAAAQAGHYEPAQEFIDNPDAFPACHTKSGKPVRYLYGAHIIGIPAQSTLEKNKVTGEYEARIIYSPGFNKLSVEEQRFAAEHECAHHRRGHFEGGLDNMSAARRNALEREADCEAVLALRKKGAYTPFQLKQGMATILKYEKSIRYSSGPERFAHTLRCLNDAAL
ncbi:MAG: hypothetical protein LRY57_03780 [Alphaproteobacteria bacterium]|nr:hypothetical protein [Alphaproteobacteria bacterium]